LRRAGVSLKRALVFNLVSGILCLLGVLIGLLIGSNDSLKNWAFLFIAGTFLYISLVDMVKKIHFIKINFIKFISTKKTDT
jgi:zinc transporter 10